ncbi:MAG TPA: LuxR C-terminal-related transcriptional regulator [Bryobacteraceae bacterium]|nr:LuxR C-terminal-related transcriptional regulator [Bryobacteraceae bacterium]
MSKLSSSEPLSASVRHSFHCVILEQRAALEELKACTDELHSTLEDFLAICADLRTSALSVDADEEPVAVYAPASSRPRAANELTLEELKAHADAVLTKGQEAIQESLRIRRRSSKVRAALQSGIPKTVHDERASNNHRTPGALSNRERQVLKLIVAGKSSKQIAAELGISFRTAVTHRASIMGKLDVHEIASVVREAIRRGLV